MLAQSGELLVDAISMDDHLIQYSVWIDRFIAVSDGEDFLEKLCNLLSSGDYDEMICVDEPARTMVIGAIHRPELMRYQPFKENTSMAQVAIDKAEFNRWCKSINLSTPKSLVCESAGEVEAAAEDFGYPFVLKGAFGSGGQQVYIIKRASDVDLVFSSAKRTTAWVVQEYLGGAVGTSMFVARAGHLYTHCSVINRVSTSGGVGPAAICQPHSTPLLEDIVKTVAQYVEGITGFDWILREDGTYALIDPHFGRVAPTAVCAHLYGIDFGAAYCASLKGSAVSFNHQTSDVIVWVFPQFLQLVFQGGLCHAWRCASPFRSDVKFHFCSRGEWGMCLRQFLEYIRGQIIVFMGKWRRRLIGNHQSHRDS